MINLLNIPAAFSEDSSSAAQALPDESAQNSVPSPLPVKALEQSDVFRAYQRSFEDLTGLPLSLRSAHCWQLAHGGSPNENRFCAMMCQGERSCAECLRAQERTKDGVNGQPCTLRCPFGLVETAVGIKLGRELIAYLHTGQVFLEPPAARQPDTVRKRLRQSSLHLDLDEAVHLYGKTRVVGRRQYQAMVRLLQLFAEQLGSLVNQMVLRQSEAPSARIAQVRGFIETHYREKLSLESMARRAGMSPCRFCREFKKAAGTHFTDYVSRVRVEHAKRLLLNPNYRVNEVVFEVGFRSLSHFDRVFQRIAGQSATDWRRVTYGAWK